MKTEVKALQNRGCWRVFRTPAGVRLIKSKFVYKLKRDCTGKIVKRKSRLVVLGCLQREGVDYDERLAPVAKSIKFRLMLALSQVLKLEMHQLDVDSAFPYADLEEKVYMSPLPDLLFYDMYIERRTHFNWKPKFCVTKVHSCYWSFWSFWSLRP
jgi:hypothetical protein